MSVRKAELKSTQIKSNANSLKNKICFLFGEKKSESPRELSFSLELSFLEKSEKISSSNFVFLLEPENEILAFSEKLGRFLTSENQNSFFFQPAEASFELEIKALDRFAGQFRVFFWVDLGEVFLDFNTWDSLGIRFVTSESEILSFVEELR